MFRINTNTLALIAQRSLFNAATQMSPHLERLSSGVRINRAADDAAGLSMAESMRLQLVGQRTARDNISRAMLLVQVADSGLEQIGSIMLRLKELAVQAASDTVPPWRAYGIGSTWEQRYAINKEAYVLINEIERIAQSTTFNGTQLLATSGSTSLTFYIGDGTSGTEIAHQRAGVAIPGVSSSTTTYRFTAGLTAGLTGSVTIGGSAVVLHPVWLFSQKSAASLVPLADRGVNLVAQARTILGAFQNRMERAQSNLDVAAINTIKAESIIRDADFAAEASALVRAKIVVQASTSMLRLAQFLPQTALQFLLTTRFERP